MFDEATIKAIANAGMGLGSLVVMAIVFVYQLKTNKSMMDKFSEKMEKNTEATNEMTKTLVSIQETNRQMVEVAANCKYANR